jgi:hypothetical protein
MKHAAVGRDERVAREAGAQDEAEAAPSWSSEKR